MTEAKNQIPVVEMICINKHFPGVVANDAVSLEVKRGEVHALLGENGAGKTTLMNILAGLYLPDNGDIFIDGDPLVLGSPKDSINSGIGVVHQHFRLVEVFSVAENITMGLNHPRIHLDMRKIEKEVSELAAGYGWNIDPRKPIWQLSVGEQQRVEILKALYLGAKLLVLDEPTAVLTPQEAHLLGNTLKEMTKDGKAVIYISHKLEEVMEVADRITVLKAGKNVGTVEKEKTSIQNLTKMMVGREVSEVVNAENDIDREALLSIRNLHIADEIHTSLHLYPVRNFNIQVRRGEIVGLAGVSGNGQKELAYAIAGLRRVHSGQIFLGEEEITNIHPAKIIEAGISFIPADRLGMGLVQNLNVYDNVILKSYKKKRSPWDFILDWKAIKKHSEQLIKDFSVKVARPEEPVWKLSGGNLQRLLLAREMTNNPRVMVAVHPTRGLDIQAAAEIHKFLIELSRNGTAIFLISEDLDELVQLSDTIAVMYNGENVGMVDRKDINIEEIGLMMAGALRKEVIS